MSDSDDESNVIEDAVCSDGDRRILTEYKRGERAKKQPKLAGDKASTLTRLGNLTPEEIADVETYGEPPTEYKDYDAQGMWAPPEATKFSVFDECQLPRMSDVIGEELEKQQLIERFELPTEAPGLFDYDDRSLPNVIFYGPPGTGKTTLAQALVPYINDRLRHALYQRVKNLSTGETWEYTQRLWLSIVKPVPWVMVSAPTQSMVSSYQGASAQNAERAFLFAQWLVQEWSRMHPVGRPQATKLATYLAGVHGLDLAFVSYATVFVDEFEEIARSRTGNGAVQSSSGDTGQTVQAFLNLMTGADKLAKAPNVNVIATTNLLSNIDSAVLRRFSVRLFVDLSSFRDRLRYLFYAFHKYVVGVPSEAPKRWSDYEKCPIYQLIYALALLTGFTPTGCKRLVAFFRSESALSPGRPPTDLEKRQADARYRTFMRERKHEYWRWSDGAVVADDNASEAKSVAGTDADTPEASLFDPTVLAQEGLRVLTWPSIPVSTENFRPWYLPDGAPSDVGNSISWTVGTGRSSPEQNWGFLKAWLRNLNWDLLPPFGLSYADLAQVVDRYRLAWITHFVKHGLLSTDIEQVNRHRRRYKFYRHEALLAFENTERRTGCKPLDVTYASDAIVDGHELATCQNFDPNTTKLDAGLVDTLLHPDDTQLRDNALLFDPFSNYRTTMKSSEYMSAVADEYLRAST